MLVVAVYWLLRFDAPPLAGFILAALATFLGTSIIYFCLVRPLWFVRPFFGLKTAGLADSRQVLPPEPDRPGELPTAPRAWHSAYLKTLLRYPERH